MFLLSICQLPIERFHSLNSSKSKAKVTTSMVGASPQARFIMHMTKKRHHIRDLMARKSKTCEYVVNPKSLQVSYHMILRVLFSNPFLISESRLLQGCLGFDDVPSNMQQLDLACF